MFLLLKRHIWNKRILLFWNRLWIRKDEFHSSLNFDIEAFSVMDAEEKSDYLFDLNRRRTKAHMGRL
jgi:hypothetical protein